jgi:hypothetical protein
MARYDSFLLRIWRSVGDGGTRWAIRLEHVQQGGQQRFTSLEALLAHLRTLADPPDVAHNEPVSGVAIGAQPYDDGDAS